MSEPSIAEQFRALAKIRAAINEAASICSGIENVQVHLSAAHKATMSAVKALGADAEETRALEVEAQKTALAAHINLLDGELSIDEELEEWKELKSLAEVFEYLVGSEMPADEVELLIQDHCDATFTRPE